jgi:hypothetical protein
MIGETSQLHSSHPWDGRLSSRLFPRALVEVEFYFYRDLYRDGFAVQGCRLELPRLHSLNRFFIKTMSNCFYYTDVTRASIGFDDDA